MNIWNDPWLPSSSDGRIKCQNINIKYSTVSHLINSENGTWNTSAINKIVEEDQAKVILSIPLVKSPLPDKKIWRLEGSGAYFMKTGYRLLLQENSQLQ